MQVRVLVDDVFYQLKLSMATFSRKKERGWSDIFITLLRKENLISDILDMYLLSTILTQLTAMWYSVKKRLKIHVCAWVRTSLLILPTYYKISSNVYARLSR